MKFETICLLIVGLVIIGYFGIFWTLNLSNMSIDISMDEETKESLKIVNEIDSKQRDSINYENCLIGCRNKNGTYFNLECPKMCGGVLND